MDGAKQQCKMLGEFFCSLPCYFLPLYSSWRYQLFPRVSSCFSTYTFFLEWKHTPIFFLCLYLYVSVCLSCYKKNCVQYSLSVCNVELDGYILCCQRVCTMLMCVQKYIYGHTVTKRETCNFFFSFLHSVNLQHVRSCPIVEYNG